MARPWFVTAIGGLFIAVGVVALGYHLQPDHLDVPALELALVVTIRLLAIVGGVLLLRGSKLGRWLLVAWMAYHLVLSATHTPVELVTHAVIFIPLTLLLFHPRATAYLRPPVASN